MKKQFFLAAVAAVLSFTAVQAQGGGNFQRRTPEERLKPIHDKIDSAFKLEPAKLKQVDEIFLNSLKEMDKKMEDLRAGGQPDRDATMAARKEVNDARDVKLKEVLTEAQLKTWKEEIEPSMRQQRGGGGARPGGGGQ